MAETKTKPTDIDQIPDEEPKQQARAKKVKEAVAEKTQEEQLEEDIAVFEPVAKSVDRTLTLGEEQKTYVQHEMGFMTKLRFTKLLSSTLRSATEIEGAGFLNELFDPDVPVQDVDAMINGLLRLVEYAPQFIEEAYLYALSVPQGEQGWALAAFENLSDDDGLDILEVFVAQNGEAMRDFFTKKLAKIGQRLQATINPAQDQAQ